MVFKHWFKFVGLVLILSILAACSQSPVASVSGELEDTVGWYIGNLPENYWLSDPRPSAALTLLILIRLKSRIHCPQQGVGTIPPTGLLTTSLHLRARARKDLASLVYGQITSLLMEA
jgi:hypothetical protein